MRHVYRKTTKATSRNGQSRRVKSGGYRAVYTDAQGNPVD